MAPQPESSNNAADQDHPDAPLPIERYSDDESRSLVAYEPYPIEDDESEIAAADSRPRHAAHAKLRIFWLKNKGMFLVLLAQMFGASMNVMTQLLEINSSMHPFQILFARMSITAVASYLYMWYARVPAPFGTRPILVLLITRATFGFLGVYGIYYSVQYLPLAEATQLAALVSLGGVILIAQPFRKREGGNGDSPGSADSYHHVLATIVAFVGVIGAAGAYTSIRMIGRRAHPLVSVTYFSSVTTIISLVAMAAVPGVPFRLPSNTLEWSFMVGLGVCGFLLQFLLTAGLSYVPPAEVSVSKSGQGSRATSMVYTQVVFALFYDKMIWGTTLSLVSAAGSVLILACAIYVAVMQEGRSEPKPAEEVVDQPRYKDVDEEA
ncbi:hypothetical protein N7494_010163 [Penicillium frequentans]|uniref:EamA domain-containing protein n=1 Tax=Penicillium frequentans TaxID=3151616 RepID=A0AAD6CTT7_9EURO|nr:hypothetical protein N7494_010163 [Penicillium glabrum]